MRRVLIFNLALQNLLSGAESFTAFGIYHKAIKYWEAKRFHITESYRLIV